MNPIIANHLNFPKNIYTWENSIFPNPWHATQNPHILIYSILACLGLFITENIYHPVYIVQLFQKVTLFVVIPVALWLYLRTTLGRFGRIGKPSFLYGIGFGLLSVVIISLAYYFLRDVIDWGAIRASVNARWVNETTFLLAFAYIMFGNSLIEEYFFRGMVFRSLFQDSPLLAYITSSVLFSLYHIAIFGQWFSGFVLYLALFWLFVGGLFFAWLYRKTDGIWWAWIFHILADLSILVIGYMELFS